MNEAKMLLGAKNVVIDFDKLFPNKAIIIKLSNGKSGIRYTNCCMFYFLSES
jgi:hypothetical protein